MAEPIATPWPDKIEPILIAGGRLAAAAGNLESLINELLPILEDHDVLPPRWGHGDQRTERTKRRLNEALIQVVRSLSAWMEATGMDQK